MRTRANLLARSATAPVLRAQFHGGVRLFLARSRANDLIDRSPFPEGPSARFDSTSPEVKSKEATRPGVGSADRSDLRRPYLNYSEKLISFFHPFPRGNPLNVSASDVDLVFKENLGMRTTVQSRRRSARSPAE